MLDARCQVRVQTIEAGRARREEAFQVQSPGRGLNLLPMPHPTPPRPGSSSCDSQAPPALASTRTWEREPSWKPKPKPKAAKPAHESRHRYPYPYPGQQPSTQEGGWGPLRLRWKPGGHIWGAETRLLDSERQSVMTAADASELYLGDLSPCPPWRNSDSDVSVAGAGAGAGAVRAGVVGSAPRMRS